MAEIKEPSFGKLVGWRALALSSRFFLDIGHDLAVGLIAILITCYRQYSLYGLSASLAGAKDAGMTLFIPFFVVWLGLFFWHLWLAPAALAYEAVKAAHEDASKGISTRSRAAAPQLPPEPVNWEIWKKRTKYNLYEFAAILAKSDPIATSSSRSESAFFRLLIEKLNAERARVPRRGDEWMSPVDGSSEISRTDALQWAEKEKFDVSHIK